MRGGLTIRSGRPGRYRLSSAWFAGLWPILVRGQRAGQVSRGTAFVFFPSPRISFSDDDWPRQRRGTEALRLRPRPPVTHTEPNHVPTAPIATVTPTEMTWNELLPFLSRPFCLALDSKYQSHPPASGNTRSDQMMLFTGRIHVSLQKSRGGSYMPTTAPQQCLDSFLARNATTESRSFEMRLAGPVICILRLIPPCSTETSDDGSGTASMCSSITPQTPCPHIPLLGHRAGLTCRQALMCAGDPRFVHASASSVCCARHASPAAPGRPRPRLVACRLKTTASPLR